jgi:predicted DNA-binding transcriptional regulator YafY
MRGEQLARQWRILRTIESRNHGITVAELAVQEGCHSRTIWRDLAAIQEAGFPLYSEKDGQKTRLTCLDFRQGTMLTVQGKARYAIPARRSRMFFWFVWNLAEGHDVGHADDPSP